MKVFGGIFVKTFEDQLYAQIDVVKKTFRLTLVEQFSAFDQARLVESGM